MRGEGEAKSALSCSSRAADNRAAAVAARIGAHSRGCRNIGSAAADSSARRRGDVAHPAENAVTSRNAAIAEREEMHIVMTHPNRFVASMELVLRDFHALRSERQIRRTVEQCPYQSVVKL